MAIPKSVTKIKNGEIEFISNVDKLQYTLHELTRAALRDSAKYICNIARKKIKKRTGVGARNIQYWVRSKQKTPDVQIGIKPRGFYIGFMELGSSKTPRIGAIENSVKENISKIREIQGQYLSAIEDENRALGLISEEEYEGE